MGKKPPAQAILDASPWMPVPYDLADAAAWQAISLGTADKDQQIRALRWLIGACGTYDLSYRPGPNGDRETAMAEGRRFIGLQVVKLVNLDLARLRRTEPRADAPEPKS